MSPNQAGVYSSAIILCAATTIVVGLRLKRHVKKDELGLDDAAILCALALDWAIAVILIVGATNGVLGIHSTINPETQQLEQQPKDADASKYNYIFQIFIVLGDGALKLSLLLMYRRIFVGQWFTRVTISLIVLVVLWMLCFLFGTVFWCGPTPAFFWTSPSDVAKYCKDYQSLQLAQAVSDVVINLIILAVPIPIIWRLHLKTPLKIGLIFIFLLGFISIGAGIARMVLVLKYAYETTVGARDIRSIITETSVWGYVEVTVGMITACLITFKPLTQVRTAERFIKRARTELSLHPWRKDSSHSEPQSQSIFAANSKSLFKVSRSDPDLELRSIIATSDAGSNAHLARPQTATLFETEGQTKSPSDGCFFETHVDTDMSNWLPSALVGHEAMK